MKKIIKTLLILFIVSNSVHAQKVLLKKGKVLIDETEVFNYDINVGKGFMNVYDLKTNDKLIFIKESDNGTSENYEDDYIEYHFLKTKRYYSNIRICILERLH